MPNTYLLFKLRVITHPYPPKSGMSSKTSWHRLSFGITYFIAELPNMLVYFYIGFVFRGVSLYDYFRCCTSTVAKVFDNTYDMEGYGVNFCTKQEYPMPGFILNFSIVRLFIGALLFSTIKMGGL